MTGLDITTRVAPASSPSDDNDLFFVSPNLSFSFQQDGNVRTLNNGYSPPASSGFLFVPQLDGVCSQYLPANVTRYADLPVNSSKVAIAPWISPECTLSYLGAANPDNVTAFVFFPPNSSNLPLPSANSAYWSLGDGGQWKSSTNYPVYAIASQIGQMTLTQMALYSGNVSNVPRGQILLSTGVVPPDAYVRLSMAITSSGDGSNLPSIWVFLLIILAILLVLIGALSLTMHILQRKRRNDLRARIARGEVDIEALGLGKLTVPKEALDKMPLYTFHSPDSTVTEKGSSQLLPPLQQSTCAICLDDFVEARSQVRELPCRHIFHPECIDLFMLDSSATCPLCKQSVLPQGYIPGRITSSMVRRERYLRRNAARRARHAASQASNATNAMPDGSHTRPSASPIDPTQAQLSPIEMTSISGRHLPAAEPAAPTNTQGRREWARRRALAISGIQNSSNEDEAEQRTSKARKLLRRIFPS